jgi:hypothetical protein
MSTPSAGDLGEAKARYFAYPTPREYTQLELDSLCEGLLLIELIYQPGRFVGLRSSEDAVARLLWVAFPSSL